MKYPRSIPLLILLVGCAGSAAAQEPPSMPPPGVGPGPGAQRFQMPTFAELDKNKDGKLSRDEMPPGFPPQAFDRFDEDRDGFVTEEEWDRVRQRFGQGGGGGPRFNETLTRFLDQDKDGKVSREEFARLLEVFDALDKDKDGVVSQEEMGSFFQAVNEVQARATGGVDVDSLFRQMDKDRDGKITAAEMNNERTFRALDLNKDGVVTREEAEQALKQMSNRSRQRAPQQQ